MRLLILLAAIKNKCFVMNKNNNRRNFLKKAFFISLFPLFFNKGISSILLVKEKVFKKKYSKVWILDKNDY